MSSLVRESCLGAMFGLIDRFRTKIYIYIYRIPASRFFDSHYLFTQLDILHILFFSLAVSAGMNSCCPNASCTWFGFRLAATESFSAYGESNVNPENISRWLFNCSGRKTLGKKECEPLSTRWLSKRGPNKPSV